MAYALTIPDIVESEPMLSVAPAPDGVTFGVVIDADDTAVRLMRVSQNGETLPLVVLTTDAQIIALDSVFVSEVSFDAGQAIAHVTFVAEAVRIV